jgi:hypothetical protein
MKDNCEKCKLVDSMSETIKAKAELLKSKDEHIRELKDRIIILSLKYNFNKN